MVYKLNKAGNFIEFKNGKSIKPGGEGAYPVYGANGIIGMSDEWREQNSVIIGRVGAYCGTVQFCKGQYWASDNTIVACPKDNGTDVAFLYYLLKYANLNHWAGGAAQPLMTQTVIRQIELLHPEYNIQRKISSILSAYDDLIENNTRRIQILEEMAQRIYRCWFIDFEFPVEIQSQPSPPTPLPEGEGSSKKVPSPISSPFGRGKGEGAEHGRGKGEGHLSAKGYKSLGGKMIDSELGKIPEGWEVKKVGEIAVIKGGKSLSIDRILSQGRYPVFGGNGIQGYYNECMFEGFVIAFGRVGAYCGSIHWSYNGAWLNNNASSVIPFDSPELLLGHLLNFNFDNLRGGSAQPFISNLALANINLLFPPDTIRNNFCEIVKPLRLQVEKLKEKNKVLRETRDLLLPKLISGELDVSDLDIVVRGHENDT